MPTVENPAKQLRLDRQSAKFFKEMVKHHGYHYPAACIHCGGNWIVRNGFDRKGCQIYRCVNCKKSPISVVKKSIA